MSETNLQERLQKEAVNKSAWNAPALIDDLRDDLDKIQTSAVVAPKMSLKNRLRAQAWMAKEVRPFLIRGLIAFLLVIIVGQLWLNYLLVQRINQQGILPEPLAIEQVEDDLPPLPPEP